jgi:hypothetical protein
MAGSAVTTYPLLFNTPPAISPTSPATTSPKPQPQPPLRHFITFSPYIKGTKPRIHPDPSNNQKAPPRHSGRVAPTICESSVQFPPSPVYIECHS